MEKRVTSLASFFRPSPQIRRGISSDTIRDAGGQLVWSDDLAALLWDGPELEGPQILDAALLKELGQYHSLLERLRPMGTVVPVRFGTPVSCKAEVLRLLEAERAVLEELTAEFEHKAEWDVTAQWNFALVATDMVEENQSLRDLAAKAQTAADQIRVGAEVASALAVRAEALVPRIRDTLFCLAEAHVETGPPMEGVVFQAALLMGEEKEADLDRALEELDRCFAQRVNFRCVGPLPPHSFATADIHRPRFSDVDRARRRLGLGPTATRQEIQDVFRRHALQTHPDHCPGDPDAQARFDELKQAYDVLSDYCRAGTGTRPYCTDEVCSFRRADVEAAARIVLSWRGHSCPRMEWRADTNVCPTEVTPGG